MVFSLAASVSAAERTPTVIKEIPYPGATKADRRRSLDLYLPAKSERRPPMMIFVHDGFWVLSDDDYKIEPYQPVIVIGLDVRKIFSGSAFSIARSASIRGRAALSQR